MSTNLEKHAADQDAPAAIKAQTNAPAPVDTPPGPIPVRTLFLSDIHLGTIDAKADECRRFLKRLAPQKIVLLGDIIDAWALERGGRWLPRHTRLIRKILKVCEQADIPLVYVPGNHDDLIDRLGALTLGQLTLTRKYIHTTADGHTYLCIHGDGLDSVTTRYPWLAQLGSHGYDLLLRLNTLYNRRRIRRGLPYFSLSAYVKGKVKSAISFIDDYETQLTRLCRTGDYDGIIAGHIHHAEDRNIDGYRYLNCGDWVETMSAIVEYPDGRLASLRYHDIVPITPTQAS